MNKIVRIVAVAVLGISAVVPVVALAYHNSHAAPSTQLAGGNPPPCNPKLELCIPMGL